MGLDTVDLVLKVEKAFGVNLPDERLEDIDTVGQLYALILEALRTPEMRPADQLCRICSYNLRGLRDPQCPECGTEFIFRDQASPEAVWGMLVEVLSDLVGIAPELVRPETNLLNDLDMA